MLRNEVPDESRTDYRGSDRQRLLLVLACGMAGTIAALALSRFHFLGYGMDAMAIAGALAGMLAVDCRSAIPAGVMASVLSLLVLGIVRFYRLYEIPPEPGVTALVIISWMLAGAIGSFAGAKSFRQHGLTATIVVLSIVIRPRPNPSLALFEAFQWERRSTWAEGLSKKSWACSLPWSPWVSYCSTGR